MGGDLQMDRGALGPASGDPAEVAAVHRGASGCSSTSFSVVDRGNGSPRSHCGPSACELLWQRFSENWVGIESAKRGQIR